MGVSAPCHHVILLSSQALGKDQAQLRSLLRAVLVQRILQYGGGRAFKKLNVYSRVCYTFLCVAAEIRPSTSHGTWSPHLDPVLGIPGAVRQACDELQMAPHLPRPALLLKLGPDMDGPTKEAMARLALEGGPSCRHLSRQRQESLPRTRTRTQAHDDQ